MPPVMPRPRPSLLLGLLLLAALAVSVAAARVECFSDEQTRLLNKFGEECSSFPDLLCAESCTHRYFDIMNCGDRTFCDNTMMAHKTSCQVIDGTSYGAQIVVTQPPFVCNSAGSLAGYRAAGIAGALGVLLAAVLSLGL
ncbi:hypothetical protein H696_05428 [Fonticula alba]|uniref:Uncharacterized protein n=1 Tax=Fonticula alba TaxID=691883 RepID=A0A058Z1J5_FONAL|nr:hypothetical protein H696_05428 [Fonticula alba]KCV67971.1 hypothetical protein H696_05428 [Fonticula alba]|eukprot:XP_009497538.1 hypothetical protein H696_05428 [Fonticula alba]